MYKAMYKDHLEIVKLIIPKDITSETDDQYGKSFSSLAIGGGHLEIVKLLLDVGLKLGILDKRWVIHLFIWR